MFVVKWASPCVCAVASDSRKVREEGWWVKLEAMAADTRGAAAAEAMAGAHLGMVPNGAQAKAIPWRRMLLLVVSWFWFLITASLSVPIRFVTRRGLFRAETEDQEDNSQHADSDSSPAQPPAVVTEPAGSGEDDVDACEKGEEAPVFQFRFSFQVLEENSLRGGEEQGSAHGEGAVSSATTSIGNTYRFLFERDVSGFMEAPQVVTMSVQESYVGSDGVVLGEATKELDGELRRRLPALKRPELADSVAGEDAGGVEEANNNKSVLSDDAELGNAEELDFEFGGDSISSLECALEDAGVEPGAGGTAPCGCSDSDVVSPRHIAEEVDRELKARLSAVKAASFFTYLAPEGPVHGDPPQVCLSSCPDGDALDDAEELDRDLTARFLSVKSSAGSGVQAAAGACATGMYPGRSLRKAGESEEEEEEAQPDGVRLMPAACLPAGACPLIAGGSSSDALSDSLSDGYSVKDLNLDFDSEELLSEREFEPETGRACLSELNGPEINGEFLKCNPQLEEAQLLEPHRFDTGSSMEAEFDLRQKPGTSSSSDSDDEKGEQNGTVVLLETVHPNSSRSPESSANSKHLGEHSDEPAQRREKQVLDHSEEETHDSREPQELTPEESEELESLWEHQDLIEQLRTELRKVRSAGLPTISEESESPKPACAGLKAPWKFDARFLHEDPTDELHRFYKSYREMMRKFDILNYQKMYALGFLQLNDPLRSTATQKPLIPAITSLLISHNISWPRRRRKSGGGDVPWGKFAKELQSDLETVYVGQACLSWEFLRWQRERTRDLLVPPDQQVDGRRYNQVAGEFQQFQVLVQRFLEDEPFQQGPRALNYVKNRCVVRSLLQVPMVREDCSELGKAEEKGRWEDVGVTGGELERVMDTSIGVFWEFVRADRDDTPTVVRGLMGTPGEPLQDPADRKLMADVQADLQKKEKKLRDVTRAGNCLVRKMTSKKKPRGDGCRWIGDELLLISQVDLKLVARVLRMRRITTDQLAWCRKKLSGVGFVDRKLVREPPSFSLFPC